MAERALAKRIVRSNLGPNAQSIVGGAVGLVAAFQIWLTRDPVFSGPMPRVSDDALQDAIRSLFFPKTFDLLHVITGDVLSVGFFCLIFLLGTLFAFLSPVGAFLQVLGILGFALGVHTYDPAFVPSGWEVADAWSLGPGYALGAVSTLIVLQSTVKAMLAANGGRPARMLGRVAAMSPRTISSWR